MKLLITTFFTLLLISLAGASYAQIPQIERDAIFNGEAIFIPMASVGNDYYKLTLSLIDNEDFVDLEVTEVTKLNPLNGSGSSTFDTSILHLHVPALLVGEKRYWANFSLITDSPVVFRLLSAGPIGNTNGSPLEKGAGIFTGYLSMNIDAPQSYGYGFSIYSNTTFLFNEDIDLCRAIGQNGFKVIYFPLAKITHHISNSNSKVPARIIIKRHHGMKYYYEKHHGKNPLTKMAVNFAITLRCLSQLAFNIFKGARGTIK